MGNVSNQKSDWEKQPSQRRKGLQFWLGRLLGLFVLVVVALAVAGAAYQAITTRVDARKYPPPGQLVDIGGRRLHIYCTGSGSPTVVLDALFPGTVSNWAWVQPEVAKMTRTCAYDRAGLGWSDRGPEPRDARQHAQELHALLTNAGITGPYVLVGHSLGGLSVRMYAELYPEDVAGMVLIEATNPDSWKRLGKPEGVGADRIQLALAQILARFGVFRLGLISSFPNDPDLPERQRQELQAFYNTVKSFETVRAVDNSFSLALDQVRHAGDLGATPLAVVLGSEGDGAIELLDELFSQQVALSANSFVQTISGATHAGLVDNQEAALETSTAIKQIVEAARNQLTINTGK